MSRGIFQASWDDCGHLSVAAKETLWLSIPPYQRDARSKGIPQLGSGAIYPVPESDFVVAKFSIPAHFPRCYGMDVGWNRTAAVWLAQDPDSRVIYAYDEHYMGKEEPSIHAAAIRARGAWIPGVIDPAAKGKSQRDGQELLQNYIDLGMDLEPAINAVEAGIHQVWELLAGGMLKVFDSLQNLRQEMRLYRRDENGKVVKDNDHACDSLRYGIISGRDRMKTQPVKRDPNTMQYVHDGYSGSWMS